MVILLETISKYESMLSIILLLIIVDMSIAIIKLIINEQFTKKNFFLIIWKNLTNCTAFFLSTILEATLGENEIKFELTTIFCYLIILSICKSIISTLGESELTILLKDVLDHLFCTLKNKFSKKKK